MPSEAQIEAVAAAIDECPEWPAKIYRERQARAAISAAEQHAADDGWMPIETAPKDGTEVLVYVPRRLGALYAGASNQTGSQWWSRNLGDVQPTHWRRLPAPPPRPHHQGRPQCLMTSWSGCGRS